MDWAKETQKLSEEYEAYITSGLYVHDEEKLLVADREEEYFNAASIIKLPIFLYYYEKAVQGEMDLSERKEIPVEGRANGSGVLHLLTTKKVWTVEELLHLMVAVSDNEATNQLIAHVGLKPIQEFIQTRNWAAGMQLRRYLMDYASGLVNEITPKGAVEVLQEIIALGEKHPEWKERIERPFLLQQYRNGLPGYLDEREIPVLEMLNKTGEDPSTRHDVALFRYNENTLYIAALNKEVQDEAKAISWMQAIGKLAFETVKETN